MNKRRGFLLIEALISLSILTAGLLACAQSFSIAKEMEKRGEERSRLAHCADAKIMSLALGLSLESPACDPTLQWSLQRTPLTTAVEKVVLKAAYRNTEETFETLHLAI